MANTTSSNISLPQPIYYDPSKHQHILAQIADIHHDCVIHDAMPLSILDVSNRSKLDQYWLKKHAEVEDGKRVIVLQFVTDASGNEELAGLGSLHVPGEETGPFRSWIEKLMVSPRHRRKGFAKRLMDKLEEAAVERNAGLIVSQLPCGSLASTNRIVSNLVLKVAPQQLKCILDSDTKLGVFCPDTVYLQRTGA